MTGTCETYLDVPTVAGNQLRSVVVRIDFHLHCPQRKQSISGLDQVASKQVTCVVYTKTTVLRRFRI